MCLFSFFKNFTAWRYRHFLLGFEFRIISIKWVIGVVLLLIIDSFCHYFLLFLTCTVIFEMFCWYIVIFMEVYWLTIVFIINLIDYLLKVYVFLVVRQLAGVIRLVGKLIWLGFNSIFLNVLWLQYWWNREWNQWLISFIYFFLKLWCIVFTRIMTHTWYIISLAQIYAI